jgi:uncharacterized protein (DUF433 family)
VAVERMLRKLAAGMTAAGIFADPPRLTEADMRAVQKFAAV